VGELVVSGPNVMQGHWGRPEDTRAAFCEDWFRTGDLGYQDEDGYFCIVDRKKDLIIVNGMNVYPRMIEEILHRHPAVAEVAVVGDPDPVHGEVPVAHVVLRQPGAAGAAELRRHCQADLGRHEVPRRFHFLSELPRTATGKVLKRTLRRGAEIERGVPPRPRVRERHRRSGVEIRRLLHATGGADERESGDDGAPAARSRGA
jgi:long-chain acyl-CoA synthetase